MFTKQERNDIICALEIAHAQYLREAEIVKESLTIPEYLKIGLQQQFFVQAERVKNLIYKMQEI